MTSSSAYGGMSFMREGRDGQGTSHDPAQYPPAFAENPRFERAFMFQMPAERAGGDVILHFRQGGGIVQDVFFVPPLPYRVRLCSNRAR